MKQAITLAFYKHPNDDFEGSCLQTAIEQEPEGVRVAINRNNFPLYDVVVYMSWVTKMAVCRVSAGGCGEGRSSNSKIEFSS